MKQMVRLCISRERIWPQGMDRYPAHLDLEIS